MIPNRLNKKTATNWINAVIKTNERVKERKSIIRSHSAYSKIGALELPCTECNVQLEWDMVNFSLLNEDVSICPECDNKMCIPTMVIHVC